MKIWKQRSQLRFGGCNMCTHPGESQPDVWGRDSTLACPEKRIIRMRVLTWEVYGSPTIDWSKVDSEAGFGVRRIDFGGVAGFSSESEDKNFSSFFSRKGYPLCEENNIGLYGPKFFSPISLKTPLYPKSTLLNRIPGSKQNNMG